MFTGPTYFLKQVFVPVFVLCSTTTTFSQSMVTVTNSDPHGWAKEEQYLGKIGYANGPSKPPLQKGSLEFYAPINGHERFVRMRNSNYSGLLLASITQLSYSTFVQKADSKLDAPFIVLQVDADGDGIEDTHMFFDPRYQNPADTNGIPTKFGWFKPKNTNDKAIRWQHRVRQKVWQTWDALHGAWVTWSQEKNALDTSPPNYSLSTFISQHPKARIINGKGRGGLRLSAGGIPMANNFIGNADAFTIAIDGKTTVYDFEMATDTAYK
jgi:hypothetical protein